MPIRPAPCFIGKAELDQALETRPGHPFDITWHPFRLNPDMPASGMDHVAYMKAKFGGEKGILEANEPVLKAAERLGLWINMAAIERVPPTLNAFRLLHWAGIEQAQSRVMSGLMRAYWREGRNIADPEVLADIGAGAGMDAAMILRLLATDADIQEVLDREAHARERGILLGPDIYYRGHPCRHRCATRRSLAAGHRRAKRQFRKPALSAAVTKACKDFWQMRGRQGAGEPSGVFA